MPRSTRSKSCGRLPTREPLSADPDPPAPTSRNSKRAALPPKQNSASKANVSNPPSQESNSNTVQMISSNSSNEKFTSEKSTINEHSLGKDGEAPRLSSKVSDNRGNPTAGSDPNAENDPPSGSGLPPAKPEDPWFPVFQELQEIRKTMVTITTFERSTEQHSQQLSDVAQRTSTLEFDLVTANTKVKELGAEISNLKSLVQKQGEMIDSLQKGKEDQSNSLKMVKEGFEKKSEQALAQMNELVQNQRNQVENFNDQAKTLKQEVLTEVDDKVDQVSRDLKDTTSNLQGQITDVSEEFRYDKLKSQARSNKLNLVISGLQEDSSKTPLAMAKDFFSSTLKIKGLQLDVAYRLGATPPTDSSYARPLVVRFPTVAHRDKVWHNKTDITDEDGNKIRINADLPRRLRNDSQLLHRVQKAASKIPRFKAATVKDYRLYLDGKSYAPNELESLPDPIKPSTLATPKSETAVAFFSRHSVFSNHYLSKFTVKGVTFNSMEQYLAYRKAKFANEDLLASQALSTQDPVEAKYILNKLKKSNPAEWYKQVPKILAEGLREKFKQNQYLLEILIDTRGLQLGEASKDSTWGIGMSLTDPHVLDVTKWLPKGNLLGRALMEVRDEIRMQATPHNTPSHQKRKPAQGK